MPVATRVTVTAILNSFSVLNSLISVFVSPAEQTEHGGAIKSGDKVVETTRSGYEVNEYVTKERIDFNPNQLDRSVVSPDQIRKNMESFRDSIYTDMFPERKALWEYIPKTLIFAKDDHHASEIVNILKLCSQRNSLISVFVSPAE